MSFETWGIVGPPFFLLPANYVGYVVTAIYALALLIAVVGTFPSFLKLKGYQWILLAALVVVAPLLITALRIRWPGAAAPPGVPLEPVGPTLSLLGFTPVLLAAGLLGVGPALLVGLVAGIARAGWETYRITTLFEMALAAALLAWFVRQDYRGPVARVARLPIIATVVTATMVWLASYFSYFANSTALGLIGFDFVNAEWARSAVARFGELVLGGVIGTLASLGFPGAWAPTFGNRAPPYSTSLNRKLVFTIIPLAVLLLLVVISVALGVADGVAADLIVDQMGRNALGVANTIPYFSQTGQSILNAMALDAHIQNPDAATGAWLEQQIRAVAFFRSLAFFDQNGKLVAAYPPDRDLALGLSSDEQAAMALGIPDRVTIDPASQNEAVVLSFIVPVTDVRSGALLGTLIGRTDIEENPILKPAIEQLKSLTLNSGAGFIVDERSKIIFHTSRAQLTQAWLAVEQPAETLTTDIPGGRVYRDRDTSNNRILVYYLPVSGYPWAVAIVMPNDVVLAKATQITTPLIMILVLAGLIGGGVVLTVTGALTRPLETLAEATAGIAQGELDQPVKVAGEDEVGRLGIAFERMRERLRARLGELNLLLRVSQGIAGSLNLDLSLPAVLEGALSATSGGGARLVILDGAGPLQVFASGPLSAAMAPLDKDVLELTQNEGRLVLENLSHARTVLSVTKAAGQVQALIALPLKQEARFLGALWVGFNQPHPFTQAEVNFCATLAGQAALAVSSAHLYEASEGGRQQLQAILASSPDAVIVTDSRERVLLINPAAENIFDVTAKSAVGKPLNEVIDRPELIELMRANEMATPRQVPLADGRTLYASASPIAAADGSLLGRVAVLRDVTYFKQLDELKSEFVATVSHDLRVPLTYMRGYAAMLPMVGQLNPKQAEFAAKIVSGIEQMSELIEDLLDLNRIEAGVGVTREPCRVDEIINEAVANLRNNAANKNITLTIELLTPNLPSISGDKTLLRQAVSNLVDNAIKYTNNNGKVKVYADVRDNNVIIAVQDNGIGIAPGDQARLFEKFFRVRQRDTLAIKGSGLGLAIVKSISDR
ncbi:MAG: ATP-binding protein, partial [Chloroflexota bacterium]